MEFFCSLRCCCFCCRCRATRSKGGKWWVFLFVMLVILFWILLDKCPQIIVSIDSFSDPAKRYCITHMIKIPLLIIIHIYKCSNRHRVINVVYFVFFVVVLFFRLVASNGKNIVMAEIYKFSILFAHSEMDHLVRESKSSIRLKRTANYNFLFGKNSMWNRVCVFVMSHILLFIKLV